MCQTRLRHEGNIIAWHFCSSFRVHFGKRENEWHLEIMETTRTLLQSADLRATSIGLHHRISRSLTEITIAGVGSFSALSAGRRPTGSLGAHLTGLGDWGDKVLIVRVPPAPPADLRLAAPGDHRPVLLVPDIQITESLIRNTTPKNTKGKKKVLCKLVQKKMCQETYL